MSEVKSKIISSGSYSETKSTPGEREQAVVAELLESLITMLWSEWISGPRTQEAAEELNLPTYDLAIVARLERGNAIHLVWDEMDREGINEYGLEKWNPDMLDINTDAYIRRKAKLRFVARVKAGTYR